MNQECDAILLRCYNVPLIPVSLWNAYEVGHLHIVYNVNATKHARQKRFGEVH